MDVFRNQPWSRDPCYSSFWAHFNAVEKWKIEHARMAFIAQRLAYGKRKHYQRESELTYRQHIRRQNQEPVMMPYMKNSQAKSDYEDNVGESEIDTSLEADNEEMSEEMVEFFKKTIEHRKNRAAEQARTEQRNAEQSSSDTHWIQLDGYIWADQIGIYGDQERTFAEPDEAERNRLRRENARLMYGRNAERILAMETLLDMRFEQEYAKKRPRLWPSIPLKL